MPLRVLGGMEEQPEHGRRQLEAAHSPRFEQCGLSRAAELRHGALDLPLEGRHERGAFLRRKSGLRLRREKSHLFLRERITPRVSEKPVQTSRGMADMEPHGSRPTGTSPEAGR